MNDVEKVKTWLYECKKEGILPWEYDFKKQVFINLPSDCSFNANPVKRILEKECNCYGNPICETESCDLMQAIYRVLWEMDSIEDECDADVMNSFWTIFRNFVQAKCSDFIKPANEISPRGKFPNKKGVFRSEDKTLFDAYKESGVKENDTWVSLILRNYDDKFEVLNESSLQKTAKLSHTIGNFTLVPKGFNSRGMEGSRLKHNDMHDTWSQTLNHLKGLDWINNRYLGCSSWEEYCVKFKMNGYKSCYSYTNVAKEQEAFLDNVNTAIEERGKTMTQMLCNKMGIDFNMFKEN